MSKLPHSSRSLRFDRPITIGELVLKRLWLFLLVSAIDGPAIVGGSVVGARVSRYFTAFQSGQPGLFIGAIVGGIAGVAVAISVAVRLRLIPVHIRRRTILGGLIGFAVACLSALTVDFDSPIGPALSGALVPLGAVIGSRNQAYEPDATP